MGSRISGVIRAWISHDLVNRASVSLGPSRCRSFAPACRVRATQEVLQAGAPRETPAGTGINPDEEAVMDGPNNPTVLRRAWPGADLPEVQVLNWWGGARTYVALTTNQGRPLNRDQSHEPHVRWRRQTMLRKMNSYSALLLLAGAAIL